MKEIFCNNVVAVVKSYRKGVERWGFAEVEMLVKKCSKTRKLNDMIGYLRSFARIKGNWQMVVKNMIEKHAHP